MAPNRAKRPKMMVAEALAGRILSGRYRPGELIPPEGELLGEFGVSRTCMREALQMLSAKGFMQSKPRIGTTVTDSIYWSHLDADVLRWRQQVVGRQPLLRELFVMRRLIEPKAASLAARNIDTRSLAALRQAVFDMARNNGARTAQTTEADVAFHRILLAASGNTLMSGFGAVVEEALRASIWITSDPANSAPFALDMHIAVFEAVSAGDSAAAQQRMTALLDTTAEALRRAGFDCGEQEKIEAPKQTGSRGRNKTAPAR
jgi:DNA-binding FadR family transcriptional regulator